MRHLITEYCSPIYRSIAVAVSISWIAFPAAAEIETAMTSTLSYRTEPVLVGEWPDQALELEMAATLETDLSIQQETASGGILWFGIGLDTTAYPSADADRSSTINLMARYQLNLDDGKKWQFRVQLDQAYSVSESVTIFDRTRLGGRLQYKHSPTRTTRAQARIGYRNQNDALFQGYDQQEFYADITHEIRPNNDRLMFAAIIFGEARRADINQYSYDEIGTRLIARFPVSDRIEIKGRLSAYQRDFDAAFSSAILAVRSDTRYSAQVRVDQVFSDNVAGFAFVGWDANQSNIAARAYDGATFGIGLKISWD